MGSASIEQMAERVAELMADRLGVSGRSLTDKLKRGGRKLPRRVRKEAEALALAAEHAAHPVLSQRVDAARTARAYDACLRHLKPIGAEARWRGRVLDFVARVAWIVLVTLVLALGALAWLRP